MLIFLFVLLHFYCKYRLFLVTETILDCICSYLVNNKSKCHCDFCGNTNVFYFLFYSHTPCSKGGENGIKQVIEILLTTNLCDVFGLVEFFMDKANSLYLVPNIGEVCLYFGFFKADKRRHHIETVFHPMIDFSHEKVFFFYCLLVWRYVINSNYHDIFHI